MFQSNSIFKTGWTALILVGAVLLLFCAWLFLKVYQEDTDRTLDRKQVQMDQEAPKAQTSSDEETGDNTDDDESDPREPQKGTKKTGDADDPEAESTKSNQATTTPEEKHSQTSAEDKEHTSEPEEPSKKQGGAANDETTGEKNPNSQEPTDLTKQNEQSKEQKDSDQTKETAAENESVQVDREKLSKAKELYSNKAYEKAIQQLDDLLIDLGDGRRAEELRELKSTWTTEYRQRQKLAEQWVTKAEKAAEKKNWSTVVERANNALEHVPANARAEELIKRANEMKAYEGMVKIPGGTFSFLDAQQEVDPFYIDRFEVTNAEYKTFMEETGHPAPIGWDGRTVPTGREDHPVSGISYEDARAYASWAGKQLPTEQQWEVAARGTSGRPYPWGRLEGDEGSAAANTVEMGVGGSLSVDELSEGCTPEGVCHLVGNVAEWTRTTARSENGDVLQVVKGGSYLYPLKAGKPAERLLRAPDVRLKAIGFRCVKPPK